MADSCQKAQEQIVALTYLLSNLGFIVYPEKSIIHPTQTLEFLGMPPQGAGDKIHKIRQEARALLKSFIDKNETCTVGIPMPYWFYKFYLQRPIPNTSPEPVV